MNSSIILSFSTASLLSDPIYYILCVVLAMAVLLGIHFMSKVETAKRGNQISALAIALGIIITLIKKDILPVWLIYPGMVIGLIIGLILAKRVKMIQMPQLVALLNGIGGAASAIVASFALITMYQSPEIFGKTTASLAIVIGAITLFGSLVAAGKLHKVLPQKPVILPGHEALTSVLLLILLVTVVLGGFLNVISAPVLLIVMLLFAAAFGVVFSIRIGGADMPITISLLNSLSGVAAAIAGFAVTDILLVAVGGIVGASGLFLTQIMCRAMNRNLMDILLGKTALQGKKEEKAAKESVVEAEEEKAEEAKPADPTEVVKAAKSVIIVPGYGMALAHAQHLVKSLAQKLSSGGAVVKYAIHPVAGRMPGHMDVLLIEAGVPFEDVYEMDDINEEFKDTDVTIVIGANDVLNPAARNAEGTPIYGMPILNVDQCNNIVIFNYDLKPGYSGVDNPIYDRKTGVWVVQGDAKDTLADFLTKL
jgi:H+-translocating NAD(P) transhydrogenase subunit beta